MRSGKLDRKITIQQVDSHSIDEYGGVTTAYIERATVRAELIQRNTQEFLEAQGATDTTVAIFRIRYLAEISNDDQVLFDGSEYNIREVAIIGVSAGWNCEQRGRHDKRCQAPSETR